MANFHEKIALAEEELETMKSKVCAKEKEILQMKEIASKVELALDECYVEDHGRWWLGDDDKIRRVLEKLVRENHNLKKELTEKPTTSKKVGGSKKSGGGKKVSKMTFENDIPGHYRTDKCSAVKMKNIEGETKWTNLTVSQCAGKPLESGLCKKCEKDATAYGGVPRCGVCSEEQTEIDAEFVKQFDNPEFKKGVSKNHCAFIERIVAQFQ